MTLTEAVLGTLTIGLALLAVWSIERRLEQKHRRERDSHDDERRRFRLALELARSSSGSNVVAFRATRARRAARWPS